MAFQISDILFIYFAFIFLVFLPTLKVLNVELECFISLNSEGPPFWCHKLFVKFYFSFIFACVS